jgi:hypothetical protein
VPETDFASVLVADISEFEPDIADSVYLNWSQAVIIRAAYGDQHDDKAWYGGQRRALLHQGGARFVGIYQYLVADQDPTAQAQALNDLVGDLQPGEVLIPDFEEGQRAMLTGWYNAQLADRGPGIDPCLWTYTGLDFGEASGALPVQWIAAYQADEPATPHRLWQFTDAYEVPGVGVADCSIFHGSIDLLAAFAYQAPVYNGSPFNIAVTPGHSNFHATWDPPSYPPERIDHYELWVYEGGDPSPETLVATYPRVQVGTFTSPDPGGLQPGTPYTLRVIAADANSAHIGAYGQKQFKTGGTAASWRNTRR